MLTSVRVTNNKAHWLPLLYTSLIIFFTMCHYVYTTGTDKSAFNHLGVKTPTFFPLQTVSGLN